MNDFDATLLGVICVAAIACTITVTWIHRELRDWRRLWTKMVTELEARRILLEGNMRRAEATPIVPPTPPSAAMPEAMRQALLCLGCDHLAHSGRCTVVIENMDTCDCAGP